LGIVNVAILRTALRRGGTAGFLVGLGSCAGDLIYFTLAVLGGTALLKLALLRWALWVFGTVVLLFMAWRMVREVIHPKKLEVEDGSAAPVAPSALLATGFGLAVSSPSSVLWFAAVGGSVIASLGGDWYSVWPFAVGFFVAGVAWSALFAFGTAGVRHIVGAKLVQALSLISALLFLYFAAMVFVRGLRQIL
jgi:L-lysine exporter family protein LysE/ArgO